MKKNFYMALKMSLLTLMCALSPLWATDLQDHQNEQGEENITALQRVMEIPELVEKIIEFTFLLEADGHQDANDPMPVYNQTLKISTLSKFHKILCDHIYDGAPQKVFQRMQILMFESREQFLQDHNKINGILNYNTELKIALDFKDLEDGDLACLSRVKTLSLLNCENITDEGLLPLTDLENLKVAYNGNITIEGLMSLPSLKVFVPFICKLTNDDLEILKNEKDVFVNYHPSYCNIWAPI